MRSINILILLWLFVALVASAELKIESRVDKEKVKVGEVFDFSIEVSGGFRSSPRMSVPQLENFRVLSRHQTYDYSLGAEGSRAKFRYGFSLVALEEGEHEIKGFRLSINEEEYEIAAVQVEVEGVEKIPEKKELPETVPIPEGGLWI